LAEFNNDLDPVMLRLSDSDPERFEWSEDKRAARLSSCDDPEVFQQWVASVASSARLTLTAVADIASAYRQFLSACEKRLAHFRGYGLGVNFM